jgi:hypothetical protein
VARAGTFPERGMAENEEPLRHNAWLLRAWGKVSLREYLWVWNMPGYASHNVMDFQLSMFKDND